MDFQLHLGKKKGRKKDLKTKYGGLKKRKRKELKAKKISRGRV
jgi:hypothetical protein